MTSQLLLTFEFGFNCACNRNEMGRCAHCAESKIICDASIDPDQLRRALKQ